MKIISTNASGKAHHLFGLPPSKILEAAATAANFWDFQRRLHLHKMMEQSNNTVPRSVYDDLVKARQEDRDAIRRMESELEHYKERLHRAERELHDSENTAALQIEHHHQSTLLHDRYSGTSGSYMPANMPTPRFDAVPKYTSESTAFYSTTAENHHGSSSRWCSVIVLYLPFYHMCNLSHYMNKCFFHPQMIFARVRPLLIVI